MSNEKGPKMSDLQRMKLRVLFEAIAKCTSDIEVRSIASSIANTLEKADENSKNIKKIGLRKAKNRLKLGVFGLYLVNEIMCSNAGQIMTY
ncbi:MAG TPA: hypothetical protein VJP79_12030 [Nitrososphaera sp.]|nr:hypothetical protein [Nitrososphaera sp.]